MMYLLPGQDRIKRLFGMIGAADYVEAVGSKQKDVLRVLMLDDMC